MPNLRRLMPAAILFLLVAGGAAAVADPRHRTGARHRPRVYVQVYRGHPFYYGHGYPGYYYPGPYAYYPAARPDYAIVDTDISPEEATVYLDGERMGEADDFDGFPEYLTVPPGRHVLEFRKSGYRSLRIDINARRGGFYDIDRHLSEGRSKDSPRTEDWGGGPPRRRHQMQSTPPRTDRGEIDRDTGEDPSVDLGDEEIPDDLADPDEGSEPENDPDER